MPVNGKMDGLSYMHITECYTKMGTNKLGLPRTSMKLHRNIKEVMCKNKCAI